MAHVHASELLKWQETFIALYLMSRDKGQKGLDRSDLTYLTTTHPTAKLAPRRYGPFLIQGVAGMSPFQSCHGLQKRGRAHSWRWLLWSIYGISPPPERLHRCHRG